MRMQEEIEKTTQIKQRYNTMKYQFQGLEEKSESLSKDIDEARDEIMVMMVSGI